MNIIHYEIYQYNNKSKVGYTIYSYDRVTSDTLIKFDTEISNNLDELNITVEQSYACAEDMYALLNISEDEYIDNLKNNNLETIVYITFFNGAASDQFYRSDNYSSYEEYLNLLPYRYYIYYYNTKRLCRYDTYNYDEYPSITADTLRFELSDLDDSIEGYKLGDYVEFYCENSIKRGYITVAPDKIFKFDSREYEIACYDENNKFILYAIDDFPKIHYNDIIRVISGCHYDILKRVVIDEDHDYTKEYIEKIKKLISK